KTYQIPDPNSDDPAATVTRVGPRFAGLGRHHATISVLLLVAFGVTLVCAAQSLRSVGLRVTLHENGLDYRRRSRFVCLWEEIAALRAGTARNFGLGLLAINRLALDRRDGASLSVPGVLDRLAELIRVVRPPSSGPSP